jgi:hypothetical protein
LMQPLDNWRIIPVFSAVTLKRMSKYYYEVFIRLLIGIDQVF